MKPMNKKMTKIKKIDGSYYSENEIREIVKEGIKEAWIEMWS